MKIIKRRRNQKIILIVCLVIQIATHSEGTVIPQNLKKANHLDVAASSTLFRRQDTNGSGESGCDGYTMFMEDVGIFFTTVDVITVIADLIPKTIEKGIEAFDIWVIYIAGTPINYVDFNYATNLGPFPGEEFSIAMAALSLVNAAVEVTVMRPIGKFVKLWDQIASLIGHISLIVGLTAQFEDEIFKAIGIKEPLQEYLKDYNCYSKQRKRS